MLKWKAECVAMGQKFRRGFTATEKTELWDRWQKGESLKAIGRAFGKPSSSIYYQVAPHGDSSGSPASLAIGVDARGGAEISRGVAGINRPDRWPATGPLALDGEPRTWPQWRL